MNRLLAVVLISLLLAGCASKPRREEKAKQSYEDKLRQRVQIGMYDSSPRSQSDHVEVFNDAKLIQKAYKEIALLTCEGTPGEEAPMIQAIIYRARMMGANAIIILEPSRSGWGDRRVFRAKAIFYEKLK